jgi:PucR C-terminal helix-turn-helix domain/GGDEF-like domain
MSQQASAGADEVRAILSRRLNARLPEIERAVLTRVFAVSDPSETEDPAYAEGLREAVAVALGYGIAAVELGEERCPPPPPMLLDQARLAARTGISLETVLRRYFAGHALLADFMVQEAEAGGKIARADLQRPLRVQAVLFERVLAAISGEYGREAEECARSSEQRRAERVERLLAGESLDTADLAYELDCWHLGAVARGRGAVDALRRLATTLDRRLLLVRRDEETVWAWFGGRRPAEVAKVRELVAATWLPSLSFAVGEPAEGVAGWRLTHLQARAAFPIAQRSCESHVRYGDVALLASVLQDDLLATSLRKLYLAPLEAERDGGEVMRQTLRAYFAAERNVSSAAVALRVNRNTVASRLRAIEETIGRPLISCAAELEAALGLADLQSPNSAADLALR